MNGPILFTERLILRPVAAEDFERWVGFHADEQTMRFLGGVQPRSIAWRGLCTMAGAWTISGFSMFSLIERTTGRWIGRAGPWRPDGWPGNEIAWGILPEFGGLGLAHEAAVAAIDYAVDVLGWTDIIHCIHPDNAASIALAKRVGASNRCDSAPAAAWREPGRCLGPDRGAMAHQNTLGFDGTLTYTDVSKEISPMALAHSFKANPHWLPPIRQSALKDIPGEDGLPFVGNTLRMLRDPVGFGRRMIATYGPVFRNNAFGGPQVNMVGPEANELLLFDRDKVFSSEQGWGPLLNLLFPRGLMLMDFEKHRADRRVMSVAFKPEPMRHYAEALNTGIARQVSGWGNKPIKFYDAVKELTLDLAAESFLGMELGPEATRINQAFVDEVQASVTPIRIPLPGTMMARGVKARKYLVDFFKREIPKRRAGDGQDFFSQFCRATDEAGKPLSDQAIADHMNFLMMAAHDTITSSATSLVMLLGRNPEWQEKLRAEIADLGLNDDEGLAYGQLDKLELTDFAFKEALRLIPPVPSLPRRALKAFDYAGYRIPAGANCNIAIAYTHMMPDIWPEPETFDPMRFAPEAVRGRHKYAWVPFGGGAHMCLGLHFATMQIRILMVQLLRRYRIELDGGSGAAWQPWPIPRPKDGLPLRFMPLG